jgi:hypothetical protein
VLTLRGGNINTFTDTNFVLNQSRLFTEQGGNILMWSSNGNLDAGEGPKTSANFPPIVVHLDQDAVVSVNEQGGVTGAGIASLQSTPDSPPGDVFLLAPRGTVDAGAAGVRVSGTVSVIALQILNADNFKVQGASFGLPTFTGPNVGALTTASNAAGAAAKAADLPKSDSGSERSSIIIVEVLGYGGGGDEDDSSSEKKRQPSPADQQSYNPASPIKVVGYGPLTDADTRGLTEEERRKLATE